MAAATDRQILEYAIANHRHIVTVDLDPIHLLVTGWLAQPSLVLIRMRSAPAVRVLPRLTAALTGAGAALAAGAIVVVDEQKLRIHALPIGRPSP